MIRISASNIEDFRRYRTGEEVWNPDEREWSPMTLDQFISRFEYRDSPSMPMRAGSALHKALETSVAGDYDTLASDGFTFRFDTSITLDIPPVRECKAVRDYMVNGMRVTLVGMADTVSGTRVDDHKLTGSFDAERFLSGYQWRVYLAVFRANTFRWNVFEGGPDKDDPYAYAIRAFHSLTCYRYPELERDVQNEVELLAQFIADYMPHLVKEAA